MRLGAIIATIWENVASSPLLRVYLNHNNSNNGGINITNLFILRPSVEQSTTPEEAVVTVVCVTFYAKGWGLIKRAKKAVF